MSPLAAPTLLAAWQRTAVHEDRITELLACVLQLDPEARRAFCDLAGAPQLADARILTQRIVLAGRVDCEIRLTEGNRLHVVWVEVKVDAREQLDQLHRYADEQHRLYGCDATLVALARHDDRIFISARAPLIIDGKQIAGRTAQELTWRRLGSALDQVGVDRGGRRWRTAAADPSASTKHHLLSALLTQLEGEGLVEPEDPITSVDAHVIHRGGELLGKGTGAITRLLDMVSAQLQSVDASNADSWWGGARESRYVLLDDGWPAEVNSGSTFVQIGLTPTDEYHCAEPRFESAFFAGLAFEPASPDALEILRRPGWAEPAGFWAHEWGRRNFVVSKLKYVAELAVSEITLSGQARVLSNWVEEVIAEIRSLPDPRLLRPRLDPDPELP